MTVNIIGGGICGLTTAIALRRKGFDVKVLEAAPELRPIGAGIILATNAMQVAARLGFDDKLKQRGNLLESMCIRNHLDETLQEVPVRNNAARYGQPTVGVHRGVLQEVLLSQLPADTVVTGKRLARLEQDAVGVTAHFADGSRYRSDLLLGADGLRSAVRRELFGELPLRYSGQTRWRGVIEARLPEPSLAVELWGTEGGRRLGILQVSDRHVYYYYTEKQPAARTFGPDEHMPHLLAGLREFAPRYADLVAQTPLEHLHHDDISDLPHLPTWHSGRVLLLGDAAHATTPNLGQGGCQAMVDAYKIADVLSETANYRQAFERFEQMRRPTTKQVVEMSHLIGKISNIGGAVGYRLRNLMMRATPQSLNERQMARLFSEV